MHRQPGRCHVAATSPALTCEPVSGIEPLTCRLQVRGGPLARCRRSVVTWAASYTEVRWRPGLWLHAWLQRVHRSSSLEDRRCEIGVLADQAMPLIPGS